MTGSSRHVLETDARRPFGRTGLSVSPLGFGGAPIGVLATERDEASKVLTTLLDHGVNVIDTAACYHGSEAMIGDTIATRRDDFVLISKCGHVTGDAEGEPWTAETITASIDRSLERMKTDFIDVMLLHSCELAVLQQGDVIDAVVRARDAGKIRHAGYSGDHDALAWAVRQPAIAVVQTSVSFCDQRNLAHGVSIGRAHDCGVIAKRPLANCPWKGDTQYERYQSYAEPYQQRFAAMNLDINALRDATGIDASDDALWAEVALRFTMFAPGVDVAIVGTTRADHVASNLKAAAAGPLPAAAVQMLTAAFKAAAQPDWIGLT